MAARSRMPFTAPMDDPPSPETSDRPRTAGRCVEAAYARSAARRCLADRALLSIVIPAYNEEANVAACTSGSSRSSTDSTSSRDHLQRRPVDRPHRGGDPRAARARPAREDAALLAPLRPARGDARRPAGGRGRRVRRHRLRPPGSAGADRRDGRPLARGLRRRLRPAPHARGRDARQARSSPRSATRDQPQSPRSRSRRTPATSG